jgi:hypothetical protein
MSALAKETMLSLFKFLPRGAYWRNHSEYIDWHMLAKIKKKFILYCVVGRYTALRLVLRQKRPEIL